MKIVCSFYEQPIVQLAKQLLGKYLVREHPDETTIGRIVETKVYVGPEDQQACRCERINVWWHMTRFTLATQ